jgi:hypothetical protein
MLGRCVGVLTWTVFMGSSQPPVQASEWGRRPRRHRALSLSMAPFPPFSAAGCALHSLQPGLCSAAGEISVPSSSCSALVRTPARYTSILPCPGYLAHSMAVLSSHTLRAIHSEAYFKDPRGW